jgi:hypothetical protein
MNTQLVLLTPAQVQENWVVIRDALLQAVSHCKGEVEVDDIVQLVHERKMFVLAYFEKEDPKLFLACEPLYYVRRGVLNLAFGAGRGLKKMIDNHWDYIEALATKLNCQTVQISCRDSMARYAKKLVPDSYEAYTVMRKEVGHVKS